MAYKSNTGVQFSLKNLDSKQKDRFVYHMTQGSELIEIDEALYEYARKVFATRTLATLSDRFLVEITRSQEKGLHLVEFFNEDDGYFMKPANCSLEEGVETLPKYATARFRVDQSLKQSVKSEFKLQLQTREGIF